MPEKPTKEPITRQSTLDSTATQNIFVREHLEQIIRKIYGGRRSPRSVTSALAKSGMSDNGEVAKTFSQDLMGTGREDRDREEDTEMKEFQDELMAQDIKKILLEWGDAIYVIYAALVMSQESGGEYMQKIPKIVDKIENYTQGVPQEILDIRKGLGLNNWKTLLQYIMLAKATVMNDPQNPRNTDRQVVTAMSREEKVAWKAEVRDKYEERAFASFILDQNNLCQLSSEVIKVVTTIWK